MQSGSSISSRQFEIIAAAGSLLSTAGVSGLTIKNLAREMQFSESAIYRHFPGKEDIIVALLDYLATDMDARLDRAVQGVEKPLAQLEAIFINQFRFFADHPHFVVAIFSDGLMEASQKINVAIGRIMQVKQAHLLKVLTRGQREGDFTTALPAEDIAHIVMGTFRLQMYQWRIANFQFDIAQRGQRILQSVISIIKSH